jgi:histone H3/H4
MQRDMAEQTLAIIASMMQQAAHDATIYCAEAKRTVIMPRDIELNGSTAFAPLHPTYGTPPSQSEHAAS